MLSRLLVAALAMWILAGAGTAAGKAPPQQGVTTLRLDGGESMRAGDGLRGPFTQVGAISTDRAGETLFGPAVGLGAPAHAQAPTRATRTEMRAAWPPSLSLAVLGVAMIGFALFGFAAARRRLSRLERLDV